MAGKGKLLVINDWANVQRSTSNIQLSKPEKVRVFSMNVGRWTLNVERLPNYLISWRSFALLIPCLLLAFTPQARGADAVHHPIPSLLGWEAAGAHQDPMQSINNHMGHIVADLTSKKTDLPVQQKQKQVVSELDSVIKQLEDQLKKSGSGGGTNPNPTQPMPRSVLAKGPGGSGPLHDPHAGINQWGKLSPKERDQITQSQTEGFPPGYEAVLSSYYNRLAQEKVDSPAEGPTTRP